MSLVLAYSLCVGVVVMCLLQDHTASGRRNYYEVLGLDRRATDADVRTMYRKLVMQYHPDKNDSPNAERVFREVVEAFEVLSDPHRRRLHDLELGVQHSSQFGGGSAAGQRRHFNPEDLHIVSETFSGPGHGFDTADVPTGYYMMADDVQGFKVPDIGPGGHAGGFSAGPDAWGDGSLRCRTFTKIEGGFVSKRTQCS